MRIERIGNGCRQGVSAALAAFALCAAGGAFAEASSLNEGLAAWKVRGTDDVRILWDAMPQQTTALSVEKLVGGVWTKVAEADPNASSRSALVKDSFSDGADNSFRLVATVETGNVVSKEFPAEDLSRQVWTYLPGAIQDGNFKRNAISNKLAGAVCVMPASWNAETKRLYLGLEGAANFLASCRHGGRFGRIPLDLVDARIRDGGTGTESEIDEIGIGKESFKWDTGYNDTTNFMPIVEFYADKVSFIGSSAFYCAHSLVRCEITGTFAELPDQTQMSRLFHCKELEHLHLGSPNCRKVGGYVLRNAGAELPKLKMPLAEIMDLSRVEEFAPMVGNAYRNCSFDGLNAGGPLRLERCAYLGADVFPSMEITDLFLGGTVERTLDETMQYKAVFSHNAALTNVVIASGSFRYLGDSTFAQCTSLRRVEFLTPHSILIDGSYGGPNGQRLNSYDVFNGCPLETVVIHGAKWDATSFSKLVRWNSADTKGLAWVDADKEKSCTIYASRQMGWIADGETVFAPNADERAAFAQAHPEAPATALTGVTARNAKGQSRAWVVNFRSIHDPTGFMLIVR